MAMAIGQLQSNKTNSSFSETTYDLSFNKLLKSLLQNNQTTASSFKHLIK